MYTPNDDCRALIPINNYDLIKYARFIKDICDRNYIKLEVDSTYVLNYAGSSYKQFIDSIKFLFNNLKTSHIFSLAVDEDSFTGRTPFDVVLDTRKRFENTQLINNNFDWSDYMFKTFTKEDLKNGDVIKLDNNKVGIVIVDTGTILYSDDICDRLSDLNNELEMTHSKIIAVRRPTVPHNCRFSAFKRTYGELIYERKEEKVEEMTLEEVCEALGKNVKIVKSHD